MHLMESRRLICRKGHVVAMLKTDPGAEGDEFAHGVIDGYCGVCIYCGDSLGFEVATATEYEMWKSREDGHYVGSGAPNG